MAAPPNPYRTDVPDSDSSDEEDAYNTQEQPRVAVGRGINALSIPSVVVNPPVSPEGYDTHIPTQIAHVRFC